MFQRQPPACVTQLKALSILRLLLSMCTFRVANIWKHHINKWNDSVCLCTCNKVVFLECCKQIRLENRAQTWVAARAATLVLVNMELKAASLVTVTCMKTGFDKAAPYKVTDIVESPGCISNATLEKMLSQNLLQSAHVGLTSTSGSLWDWFLNILIEEDTFKTFFTNSEIKLLFFSHLNCPKRHMWIVVSYEDKLPGLYYDADCRETSNTK